MNCTVAAYTIYVGMHVSFYFKDFFYLFDTPKYLIAYNLLGLDSAPCKYLEYYMITSHLK